MDCRVAFSVMQRELQRLNGSIGAIAQASITWTGDPFQYWFVSYGVALGKLRIGGDTDSTEFDMTTRRSFERMYWLFGAAWLGQRLLDTRRSGVVVRSEALERADVAVACAWAVLAGRHD